jgi:acetyl esterase/lipase
MRFCIETSIKRSVCCTVTIGMLLGPVFAQNHSLNLWTGMAPGEDGSIGAEEILPAREGSDVERLTNVTRPRIEAYLPAAEQNTGTAVLVCPGGGYNILAYEHEGTKVVEWLNSIGVAGILLKYRVPRREGRAKHEAPLQDVQRAMSLVRKHADDWRISPDRIGMLGFSAGGHLTLAAGTNFETRDYPRDDVIDSFACRPDFLIPIYPAYLVEKGDGGRLPMEIRITRDTPPAFLAHADDDQHSAEGSARVYIALKQAGVPAELHVFVKGGHGFGMRKTDLPAAGWPKRCQEWMGSMGYLTASD